MVAKLQPGWKPVVRISSIPSCEEMPSEVQALVTEMRSNTAGVFALRIYEEQKYRLGRWNARGG
jgi:hypothetical protein